MATLELSNLADNFEDDDLDAVRRALAETGAAPLDIDDTAEPMILDHNVDDDVFVDFADRLEANDMNADVYLPVDFEDVIQVGDHRFASAHALILVLDSLREDFFLEEDEETEATEATEATEEDDEVAEEFGYGEEEEDSAALFGEDDSTMEVKDEQLRHVWKLLYRGARTAIQKGLCLMIKP
jgi:hypothetical protein